MRQVSRLCEEIDERVQAFLDRPIDCDWPYLQIDATCVKVCQTGRIVSVAVIFGTRRTSSMQARRRAGITSLRRGLLRDQLIERPLSNGMTKPGVLALESLHPLHPIRLQAAELTPSVI